MGLAAGAAGANVGVETAATEQGAAVAARWPPLIVGLKIESASRTECLSWRAGPARRIQNIDLDGTEGGMKRLADSICLIMLIARHNDPADDFHMDEHQDVQVGHHFKDGVLLNTTAFGDNCNFETQGHFEGDFYWCNKDF
jgi:hypothetical protein